VSPYWVAGAHKPATLYTAQFPSPVVSMLAKFVSYIVGAFAAVAIGRAVQVDPMKPKLKSPGTMRLKLTCEILLSTSAFKFNLRRYTSGAR
jgi:hypothetical protein